VFRSFTLYAIGAFAFALTTYLEPDNKAQRPHWAMFIGKKFSLSHPHQGAMPFFYAENPAVASLYAGSHHRL
jgi:hypothetical protein